MKTIKYILTVTALATCMSIAAQPSAQTPQMEWQSTGSMAGSGSSLPMAAQQGATTTYETGVGTGAGRNSHIRKVGKDDDIGDPGALPVGDGMLILSLLGVAYGLKRRHSKN